MESRAVIERRLRAINRIREKKIAPVPFLLTWKKTRKKIYLLTFGSFILVLAALILSQFLVYVKGECMIPVIGENALVIISRADNYEKGDIVAAKVKDGRVFVKRIIGVPGDSIKRGKGVLTVDERKLFVDEENALKKGINIPDFPEIIPKGFIFIAGDNDKRSFDSRYVGLVPISNIKGRVVKIIQIG